MPDYIAELDEKQNVAAVWVKEKSARGPSVFDPRKHIFDANKDSVGSLAFISRAACRADATQLD
jgi:hypothetical protein